MKLFRKRRIADWAGLESFLDQHAAFMVNRSMYEYARARSGLFSEQLMKEKPFQEAVEDGRWKSFPIAIANICEMIEGELRPLAVQRGVTDAVVDRLCAASVAVMAKYPVPEGVTSEAWDAARQTVDARVRLAATIAPKVAQDIPTATFPEFFDNVPFHETVRKLDYEMVHNHVRGIMLTVLERFRDQVDAPALVAELAGS